MHIHRIILRDVRNFPALDLVLWDDWAQQPLESVLLTGPNGSGKTTLLRVIAALWENFEIWLRLRRTLNAEQMAQRRLLIDAGLAAVEIRGLQAQPIWLFIAASPEFREQLSEIVGSEGAVFVGETRGRQRRPQFEPGGDAPWFDALNSLKERLQVGANARESLPNLLFMEAETRSIITPQKANTREVYSEPLYQWYITYEARDRWDGHIETMLRNLKIRNAKAFAEVIDRVSQFLGPEKRLTDFDDNLRLQVQIGKKKSNSHYIDELSEGERQCLILMFMVSRWLNKGGIVLIDEPDLHLHVSLQREFIHALEGIVKGKGGQMIVTSHSPTMWEEFTERQRIELGQGEPSTSTEQTV